MTVRPRGRAFLVPTAVLLLGAGTAAPADDEICGSRVYAYSSDKRVRKSERAAGQARAQDQAFESLAQFAFSRAAVTETFTSTRTVTSGNDPGYAEEIRLVRAARKYYRTGDLFEGGRYRMDGDSRVMTVQYCLPRDRFERARAEVLREREEDGAWMRGRFAELERAISRGDLGWAEREISALTGEIQARVLEGEIYESPLTAEARSFREWIFVWRKEVRRGGDFADYTTQQARWKIDEGHLRQAEDLLAEAEQADPLNVRARQLRDEIRERRNEREARLERSRLLAARGRFSGAEVEIRAAEALDADDAASLERARTEVLGSRAAYLSLNPRFTLGIHIGVGALGADPDSTALDLGWYAGYPISAQTPISYGLDGTARIGRFLELRLGGAFGGSTLNDSLGTEIPGLKYAYTQVSAGAGFRSVRRPDRKWSVGVSGGLATESVDVSVNIAGVSSDDSRTGAFARVQLELSPATFYAQSGFGFDDEVAPTTSIVYWADQVQFGVRFAFGK